MSDSSGALVSLALAGDDAALAQLMRRHQAQLMRFGVRFCGNDADAGDAVQEAFITLARRPQMHTDPGVLRWMFTVVKNWCLRLLRRQRLRSRVVAEDLVMGSAPKDPDMALEEYRIAEFVRDALAKLDRSHRDVIVLRDLEGLSGESVCAALELSEATMKSRLHRARRLLRDALTERLGARDTLQ